MNITIVGAGAIGGVVGAYLSRGGVNVTFVDINEDHVKAMNEKGLTIESIDESFTVPVKAKTTAQLIEEKTELDVVFLCVKALHTKEAIKSIKHLLNNDSYVVSIQNGLNEYVIADEIGLDRTVGCFINLFADYIEPGKIQYGGVGSLYIGEVEGSISPRVQKLVSLLALWGDAKASDNIQGFLWSKLAYGAILTATATSNETIADFFADDKYRDLIIELGSEVLAVAGQKGISAEGFDDWDPSIVYPIYKKEEVDKQFSILVERLRGYTKTRTGIWRDLAVRKRKTEVPEQLGPVIEEGERVDQDMTLTKKVLQMIQEIEVGARQFSAENLNELVSLVKRGKQSDVVQ